MSGRAGSREAPGVRSGQLGGTGVTPAPEPPVEEAAVLGGGTFAGSEVDPSGPRAVGGAFAAGNVACAGCC